MSKCIELAAWRITASTWLSRSSAERLASADGASEPDGPESWHLNSTWALKKNVNVQLNPRNWVQLGTTGYKLIKYHPIVSSWLAHVEQHCLTEVLQRRHLGNHLQILSIWFNCICLNGRKWRTDLNRWNMKDNIWTEQSISNQLEKDHSTIIISIIHYHSHYFSLHWKNDISEAWANPAASRKYLAQSALAKVSSLRPSGISGRAKIIRKALETWLTFRMKNGSKW